MPHLKGISVRFENDRYMFSANWLGAWTSTTKTALDNYNIVPGNHAALVLNSIDGTGARHRICRFFDNYFACIGMREACAKLDVNNN